MAGCKIEYNSDGSIQRVLDKSGKESQLFNQIMRVPIIKSKEEALEVYKQTLSNSFDEQQTFEIEDGFYSNAMRALKNLVDKNVKNVKGWINQLTDTQKNGGQKNVKQELDWIGLEDYLNEWVEENKGVTVYRGTGSNVGTNNNPSINWVAEDIKVARNYADSSENVKSEKIQTPKNPIELPYKPTYFTGEQFIQFLQNKIPTSLLSENIELLDKLDKTLSKKSLLLSEIVNNEKVSPILVELLQSTGFDGFLMKESYSTVSEPTNTYGLFKNKSYTPNLKNGNIPFEVIEQYIEDNQIEVVEVSKGSEIVPVDLVWEEVDFEPDDYNSMIKSYEEIEKVFEDEEVGYQIIQTDEGFKVRDQNQEDVYENDDYNLQTFETFEKASYIAGLNLAEQNKSVTGNEETKYDDYTLKGGEKYREVLLTLPNKKPTFHQFIISKGLSPKQEFRDKNIEKLKEEYKNKFGEEARIEDYQSNHWNESNILAHIRLNERTLPNGERVMFIEEVQSDWAQDGKKGGFKDTSVLKEKKEVDKKLREIRKEVDDIAEQSADIRTDIETTEKLIKENEYGEDHPLNKKIKKLKETKKTLDKKGNEKANSEEYKKLKTRQKELVQKLTATTPNMPYKKTDQWVGMAMRKVYQMAAQEGFDRVAWVTGEQSADRYSLEKQIESIRIYPFTSYRNVVVNHNAGTFPLDVNNEGVITKGEYKDKSLEEVLGKEMSSKIMKIDKTEVLDGEDLKVGGEGMKTFYNSILPKVAKKEAQRFDKKSKVDIVDFNKSKNKSYFETIEIEGENFYKLMIDGQFIEGVEDSTLRQNDLSENEEGAKKYLEEYIPQYTNTRGARQQLSIRITPKAKANLLQAVPLFQKGGKATKAPKEVLEELTNKLKENGLANETYLYNSEEIVNKLKELGIDEDLALQVVAYHGRTRPINNFQSEGKYTNKYGEVLSGTYFGEDYIAAAFAKTDGENALPESEAVKAEIDDSTFYEVDMQETTPKSDSELKEIIGEEEFNKISKLKSEGKIKGLKLTNTREFLSGENSPSTQYVVYDTNTIKVLKEYKGQEVTKLAPNLNDFLFQKGIQNIPNGFVVNGEVYINTDSASIDTPIHEFSHLFNMWAKQNRPDIYNKGLELSQSNEATEYINFVKENQPSLEQGTEKFNEEVLAQMIGDNGAKLIGQNKNSAIKDWLLSLWENIKNLVGITDMTPNQVATLGLNDYLNAVNRTLLEGNNIKEKPLKFRAGGNIYNTYREALQQKTSVEAGIITKDGFKPLIETEYNVDPTTEEGFINSAISSNVMHDQKVEYLGKTYLIPRGQSEVISMVNMEILKDELRKEIGAGNFSENEGHIEIDVKDNIEKDTPKGKAISALLNDIFNQNVKTNKKVSEKEVKRKLIELLNSMGVSIMSMDAYFKKYNTKNSTNPSAEALADIANRVVAFKDGSLPIEQLTEEVMHFIVETLPKEQLEVLLEEIVNTKEYQELADQYREVYKGDENLVRIEILGKVMKNITLSKIDNTHSESLVSSVIKAIQNFFQNIFVGGNDRTDLSKINNLVDALIIDSKYAEGLTPSALSQNEYVLYSINSSPSGNSTLDQFRSNLDALITSLKDAYYEVRGSDTILSRESARLRDLKDQVGGFTEIKAIADFTAMIQRITDEIDGAIEKSKSEGKNLSYEHQQLLENLENSIIPTLSALKDNFKDIKYTSELDIDSKEFFMGRMDELAVKAAELRGKASNIQDRNFDKIKESLKVGMDESAIEAFEKDLDNARNSIQNDINIFMETFGELNHASSPYLGMLKHVIEKMYWNATTEHQNDGRKFLNKMEELGLDPKEFKKLIDGNHIIDIIDHTKFNETLVDVDREIYNKIKSKNLSLPEYKKAIREGSLEEYTPEETTDYYKERKESVNQYVESIMSDEYYEEQKKRYEGISESTLRALTNISVQRAIIQKEASQKDGSIVYTEQQKKELQFLAKIRRQDKSFYDSSGTLKPGIEVKEVMTSGAIEEDGLYYTINQNPSKEAQTAYDLHKLDSSFESNTQNSNNVTQFRDQLKNQKTLKNIVNFIKNNINIRFTNEFYGDKDSYFLNNEDFIKLNKEDANDDRIEVYKKLVAKRNALLRLYKDASSPVEVLAEDMTKQEKELIASLTESIDNQRNKFEYPEGMETNTNEKVVEVNRAYKREAEAQGIKLGSDVELSFIKKNASDTGKERISKAKMAINAEAKGYTLSMAQEKLLERIEEAGGLHAYARTQVLPYFKRTVPKGYKSIEEVWNENANTSKGQEKAVEEHIEKMFADPNYDISVHQGANIKGQDTNPLHNSEYEGGFLQPKLSMFKNQKFVDMFDPVLDNKGNVVGVRKNEKLYELREAYLDLQRSSLDALREKGSHNLYMLPQISSTRAEKFVKLAQSNNKAQTFKASIRDAFKYNIDDKAYGEEGYKKTNAIPKFYLQPLEDEGDVSTDIVYTAIMMNKQAHKFKARKNSLSDAMAIEEKLLNTKYKGGKEAKSSRQYEMFKSFRDNAFFNIMEERRSEINLPVVGRVDVTKTLRLLNKYISIKNLGYNLIVPFTSMVTGLSQIQIEKWIGEYINKDSHRMAFKEFRKLTAEARNKALSSNDSSKLMVLGEYFDVYDMSEKAKDAKYSVFYRTLSKSANILHQAGNFPVIPQILLTVLMDNRIINGKVYNRNTYFREQKNAGVDKAKYEDDWKAADSDTVYSFLDISKEGVKVDRDKLYTVLDNSIENKDTYIDSMMVNIKKDIQQSSSFIDGQIPSSTRTSAQRDYLLSFIMTHRGFLSIGMQRRFKDKHFNYSSNQVEEGTYRTMGAFLVDTFDFMKKNKTANLIKALKESYKGVGENQKYSQQLEEELRQRNLIRAGKEVAAMSGIALIATLLFAMAEDEDNEDIYALQLSNYLMYRLTNETASTQLGIFREGVGVIESPVVIYNNVKDLASVANIFDGEEIKTGKYKGLSQRQRYFVKNIWGAKGIYDIGSAEGTLTTAQNYKMYNQNNIDIGSVFSSMGIRALTENEE